MDAAQQAVHHFRDLFEIRSSAAVIPKMNDLFVFWAEVTAGLGRLKEALSLDDAAQPGRILVHAADALESMDKKELRPPANRTLEDISSLTESTMARDSSSMTGGQQQAQVSPTARPDSSRVNHANDEDQGDEDGHVHLSGVSPELELAELYPSLLMSRRGSASTSRRPSQGDVLSYP